MYTIKIDSRMSLVTATLGGLLTVEEVTEYIAALQREFIAHELRLYAMIIDVTACPIQHQDVILAMGQHMIAMPKARSIAVVTGSSLARMQIRRLFTQPYARIVHDMHAARAWVLDGIEPTGPVASSH